jgi:gluconate 2-dehydrogenase gamma chain
MPDARWTASRRAFLFTTVAVVPAATLAGSILPPGLEAFAAGEAGYTPAFFTQSEWAFVNAFADRLIPADAEGPGALELNVPVFIDLQMGMPYGLGKLWYMGGPFRTAEPTLGYQLPYVPRDIYRHGIAAAEQAIQQAYGKSFTDLDPTIRDEVITRMQEGKLAMTPVASQAFFEQILQDTQDGYFSDPVHGGNRNMEAWKMIGFPGARANYTDFINQNGAKYPYGPVSIRDPGI